MELQKSVDRVTSAYRLFLFLMKLFERMEGLIYRRQNKEVRGLGNFPGKR